MFNSLFVIVILMCARTAWMASFDNDYYRPQVTATPTPRMRTTTTTEKHEIIPLLKYERTRNPDGSFHFEYEGADNSYREETAHVINADTENEALEVTGSYRYIDADGKDVEVHYTAGKNGFVPIGTNISPAISAAARTVAELPNDDENEPNSKKRYSS